MDNNFVEFPDTFLSKVNVRDMLLLMEGLPLNPIVGTESEMKDRVLSGWLSFVLAGERGDDLVRDFVVSKSSNCDPSCYLKCFWGMMSPSGRDQYCPELDFSGSSKEDLRWYWLVTKGFVLEVAKCREIVS